MPNTTGSKFILIHFGNGKLSVHLCCQLFFHATNIIIFLYIPKYLCKCLKRLLCKVN